jgi:HEAT repeat protein
MRRTIPTLWLFAALLVAADGAAQGAPKGGAAKAGPKDATPAFTMTPDVAQKLKSGSDSDVRAALDDIRLAGKSAASAVPAVVEVLQRGATAGTTEAAIDTLGDIGAEAASPTLAWYSVHRNLKIRRAAVKALVKTKGALAIKALRRALSDGDPMVRGVAATGLGALKAKEAVADLFVALDHKVNEAAVAIGQLCAPAECEQLTGKLGKLPFDVVTTGLDQVLFRPTAEVSDDDKVKVLGKVREMGTHEANKFLKDVQGRWPKTGSARVKGVIDQAVQATSGSSK